MSKLDKKNLIIGILFLLVAVFCLISIVTKGMTSYSISSLVVFAIIGIAFLKRAKRI